MNTNCTVIEEGDKYGVHTYIFTPCIVYGKGEGFGNPISIQTVAIVKAAQALGRVYKVDNGTPVCLNPPRLYRYTVTLGEAHIVAGQTWPVCHVLDNTTLYVEILRKILNGEDPGHGKNGYFLASPGSVAWDDIYAAVAASLAKRNVIGDDSVVAATPRILQEMGEALQCPSEFVPVQVGGT